MGIGARGAVARPRTRRTLWSGAALGVTLGTATILQDALAAGSAAYLPVLMPVYWIAGGLIGAATALVGLVGWDLMPGTSRWSVAAATSAAGTVLWFVWLLLNAEGMIQFVWPGTAIAAVLMSALGLVLATGTQPISAQQ